jgi:acetyl-CoA carboxylase carboxyltransferase component
MEAMPVAAPLPGTVVELAVAPGAAIARGQPLAVLESMKMQHVVTAPRAGVVTTVAVEPGDLVETGAALLFLAPAPDGGAVDDAAAELDLDHVRPDLAEVFARHALVLDEQRPEAVAKRRATGQRTARENLADLFDPDTFVEYGALAVAAQRQRHPVERLMRVSPADGVIAGIGTVDGFRCMAMAYDYTVLAGTQGWLGHKKTDRILAVAEQARLPFVMFAEGGGGRPGDTDPVAASALDTHTFQAWARLSGLIPRIAIASGRCFAGNAVLFGCADVTIATRDATIGMGGPAMIEGAGLGAFEPEAVGPAEDQAAAGVVDILADDEAHAVAVAKQVLGVFQGPRADWACADQRVLRHAVPEHRLRAYDMRGLIGALADTGSFVELRPAFGASLITGFVRVAGHPLGLLANDPGQLGGAIDADGADKAARLMQLCDAFDVPILSLCDTPGFMVGPQSERTGPVRHGSRMFVTAASLTVPIFTVVVRKGYGLGAQAMAGGSLHASQFAVSWPTGEFGPMGLEGAVRLAYRRELAAIADPAEREAAFRRHVDELYERGKAVNVAQFVEIDAVIDPADTRRWLVRALESQPPALPRTGKKRPFVDTW